MHFIRSVSGRSYTSKSLCCCKRIKTAFIATHTNTLISSHSIAFVSSRQKTATFGLLEVFASCSQKYRINFGNFDVENFLVLFFIAHLFLSLSLSDAFVQFCAYFSSHNDLVYERCCCCCRFSPKNSYTFLHCWYVFKFLCGLSSNVFEENLFSVFFCSEYYKSGRFFATACHFSSSVYFVFCWILFHALFVLYVELYLRMHFICVREREHFLCCHRCHRRSRRQRRRSRVAAVVAVVVGGGWTTL